MKALFQHVFGHGVCCITSEDIRETRAHERSDSAVYIQNDISDSCFFCEDMAAISDVYLRLQDADGNKGSEDKGREDNDSDDNSASDGPPKGAIYVRAGVCLIALYGPSSVFPSEGPVCTCAAAMTAGKGHKSIADCEILLLWRVELGNDVKWLAAIIEASILPSGNCWHNASTMKLYAGSAGGAGGAENRMSIVACLQSATEDKTVSLVKIELSEIKYTDVTNVIGSTASSNEQPTVCKLSAVRCAVEKRRVAVRTKKLQTVGVVSDILCATPRGIVGVVGHSSRAAAARMWGDSVTAMASGWGDAIAVVDVEEDDDEGDDDEDDELDGDESESDDAS